MNNGTGNHVGDDTKQLELNVDPPRKRRFATRLRARDVMDAMLAMQQQNQALIAKLAEMQPAPAPAPPPPAQPVPPPGYTLIKNASPVAPYAPPPEPEKLNKFQLRVRRARTGKQLKNLKSVGAHVDPELHRRFHALCYEKQITVYDALEQAIGAWLELES